MTSTLQIALKEFRGFLNSPAMYIFLSVFLVLSGAMMFYLQNVFSEGVATMAPYFATAPAVLMVFVPAVAMRLWAEENKAGTLELLMTLPIRDWEAVLGKFIASAAVVVLSIALTFPMPLFIAAYAADHAPVDPGGIFSGYVGLVTVGLAYLSVAGAVSAATRNQIVAYIIGATACFVLHSVSSPMLLFFVPEWLASFFGAVGIDSHARNLARGIFDTRDLLYFTSLVWFMLYVTVRIVESRRWR